MELAPVGYPQYSRFCEFALFQEPNEGICRKKECLIYTEKKLPGADVR